MPFNSITFLISFFFFVIVYYILKNDKQKVSLLIIGSYAFYAYAGIFNLLCLISITFITYFAANELRKTESNKMILVLANISIILLLILSKYDLIFKKDLSSFILSKYWSPNSFVFSLGISFYSLQAISLLADVYRNKYKDTLSLKATSLFLSFFPQSISGPIHRGNELIPQFATKKKFVPDNIIIGLKTMLLGYFYKLIVADKISIVITPIFNSWVKFDGLSLSIATLLYSFQIYFDFWGYSLIAIGIGRVLGYKININFNAPYSTSSFKEFWRRWHISLSRWMRDYVYIPLGGSKHKNYIRFSLVIFATFLVSGFWHGITYNFLLWGMLHASLYLIEDIVTRYVPNLNSKKTNIHIINILKFLRLSLFFIAISITWLVFRTDNLQDLSGIIQRILLLNSWSVNAITNHFLTTTNITYLLIILGAISFSNTIFISNKTEKTPSTYTERLTDSVFICICLVAIILIGDIGGQEFLYFKF